MALKRTDALPECHDAERDRDQRCPDSTDQAQRRLDPIVVEAEGMRDPTDDQRDTDHVKEYWTASVDLNDGH